MQASAAGNGKGDHAVEKPGHNCTGDSSKVDGDTPNTRRRRDGAACQKGGRPSIQQSRRATSKPLGNKESTGPSVHFPTSWTGQGTFHSKRRSLALSPKDQIASRYSHL